MSMPDQVAREVIRNRTDHHHELMQAPRHPRLARLLRGWADRLDQRA